MKVKPTTPGVSPDSEGSDTARALIPNGRVFKMKRVHWIPSEGTGDIISCVS